MSTYSYGAILSASEKISWKVEDLIGGDNRLDFSKPFLPEALAGVEPLTFLSPAERLVLNQIRGNEYLYIFGLVEEFILPFVLDHARPNLSGDDDRARALLRFASDEAKHIQLFHRFSEEFAAGFGVRCPVIGPADAIANAVLSHDPLSVALVTLHIEWMTQRHYLDCMKDNQDLDPQFKSLLQHHWMEEAQHAKMDVLMVEALADSRTPEQIDAAVDGYLEIGTMLDGGLQQQVAMNLEAFREATGRELHDDERMQYQEAQVRAVRWTYLGTGMTHPVFLETLGKIRPSARARIEEIAPAFS
ncbi:MAG: hypothetical protein ACE15D_18380 [Candidatus Eisenbacteria bacterium]|nr:hypothetical protein [Candidatus Eisenbacteria bacterium]